MTRRHRARARRSGGCARAARGVDTRCGWSQGRCDRGDCSGEVTAERPRVGRGALLCVFLAPPLASRRECGAVQWGTHVEAVTAGRRPTKAGSTCVACGVARERGARSGDQQLPGTWHHRRRTHVTANWSAAF